MNQTDNQLKVLRETDPSIGLENYTISYPPDNPPDIFFGTGVWIGMSREEEEALNLHKMQRGFRYRYSVTNYVELLSRLGRGPTPSWQNPFVRVRAAFRRIRRLCDPEVLPSPEMAFLEEVGLSHYLDPCWVPDPQQTAIAVDLVAKAETFGDITGMGIQTVRSLVNPRWVVNPDHYFKLTQIDEVSITNMIQSLGEYITEPLTRENITSLVPWFTKLAVFFLLFRPSSGRITLVDLRPEEKNRFLGGLTSGVGQMFQAHLTLVAKKTLNWGENVDPNDLYDAMQLLLLQDGRLFVTNDTNFFRHTKDSFVKRVVPWESFKQPPSGHHQP